MTGRPAAGVVAFVGPLTGPEAIVAGPMRNAVWRGMARAAGETGLRVELRAIDDGRDPARAAAAVAALATDPAVLGVVGPKNSGCAWAAVGVPGAPCLVLPAATADNLCISGRVFRMCATDSATAKAAAALARGLRVARLRVVADDTPYGVALAEAVREQALAAGVTVVTGGDCDAVFHAMGEVEQAAALRALRAGGYRGWCLGADGGPGSVLPALAGAAAEDSIQLYAGADRPAASTEGDAVAPFAAEAEDAGYALVHAAALARPATDPAAIAAALAKVDLRGRTGRVRFATNGERIGAAVTAWRVHAGALHPVSVPGEWRRTGLPDRDLGDGLPPQVRGGLPEGAGVETTHDSIARLGADFWRWRAAQQPRSADDIPRIERPEGWTPRWSAAAVEEYRARAAEFARRWAALDVSGAPVEDRVDHRLLRSAIARVSWEIDVLAMWRRQPRFYVDQSIGVVFDLLTPVEVTPARADAVILALRAIPGTLADGKANLTGHAVADFTRIAIAELAGIGPQVAEVASALAVHVPPDRRDDLATAAAEAGAALEEFRDWLSAELPGLPPAEPVGREAFEWFLREVAVSPYPPEQMLAIGRIEFDRAVTLELLERNRNRDLPEPALPADAAAQVAAERAAELAVREFYERHDLLSQPETLRHYRNAPLPGYLAPIRWLGVTDDLTGPSRLDEDGISYVPEPSDRLPYFYAANARDPRLGIVHEGAHYQQLALAWRHDRPLRRHYYDSGANEGIAFYNEELMLAAGLFEDAPRSREIVYNFMRLRALRVEVDVRLAIGDLDIQSAQEYLMHKVPMDEETAREEATFFAAYPGQGLTYQIGKTRILRFVADAARAGGEPRAVHDYLWRNGNVPLSLLRAEYLGLTDEWEAADTDIEAVIGWHSAGRDRAVTA